MTRGAAWTCGVALAVAAVAGVAGQTPAGGFRWNRPVTPGGDGPNRLEIDVPLVAGGAPFRVERVSGGADAPPRFIARGGLQDLRLVDADGQDVPYLLVDPPTPEPTWVEGRLLVVAPVETSAQRTSGVEIDLGKPARVDRLFLGGLPVPLLKRARLEGSGDREHWTLLVADGTIFDLPEQGLRQLELGFAAGEFRYLRVTWDDTNSGRLPLPARGAARMVTAAVAVGPPPRTPLAFERRPSEPGRSRFRLRLPGARLPIVALELSIGGGYLRREARVTESRLSGREAVPVALGAATLTRAVRGDLVAADLRVPIEPPTEAVLDLTVDDGDNPPLDLQGVTAVFAELPWIYFESPTARPLTARYGQTSLARPSYDLEALRASIGSVTPIPAAWGEPVALEPEAPPVAPSDVGAEVGSAIDLTRFAFARSIASGPAALVALPLDAAVLAHSAGALPATFADLRIVDDQGRQVPYLLERRDEPLAIALGAPARQAASSPTASGRTLSRYQVRLPYAQLPAGLLVLETSAGVFERAVRVLVERAPTERRREPWTEEIASAVWRHANPETRAPALGLRIPTVDAQDLLLTVDEGDNSPLSITNATLLLPSVGVRFFRGADAPLTLVYGWPGLAAPRYDLALLAGAVLGSPAEEIAMADEEPFVPPAPPVAMPPAAFWGVLILAVVILLALVVRLVGKGSAG